jgi:hypothetical protein
MSTLVQDIKDLGARIDRVTCLLVLLRESYVSADYKMRGSASLVQKAVAAMKLSAAADKPDCAGRGLDCPGNPSQTLKA